MKGPTNDLSRKKTRSLTGYNIFVGLHDERSLKKSTYVKVVHFINNLRHGMCIIRKCVSEPVFMSLFMLFNVHNSRLRMASRSVSQKLNLAFQ